jgi:hypothetical protein
MKVNGLGSITDGGKGIVEELVRLRADTQARPYKRKNLAWLRS